MARVCPECGEQFDDAAGVCPYDGTDLEEVDEEESPLFGEVIDERFRLGEMIGEGGMGQVYKATQLSLDRSVAVKVIRGNQHVTEEVKKRFMREADVLSTLTHPNVVRIIDYGEADEIKAPYLAMEYVDGFPLSGLLDGVRFHPNLAVEVATQIAAGLVEAHEANVVHRDLKTDNVLLVPVTSGGFQAKLIDFGIAFPDQSEGERLTQTGMICGTPQYLSPEQARGSDVDERSDLYSLGIILFEMATGVLPFRGESAFEIMVSQVQNNPPGLIDFVPPAEIPDSLNGLVDDLLAKDPADRPQDAREIRQRIQQLRAESNWGPIQFQGSDPLDEQLEPWLLGETPGGMEIETSETAVPDTYQGDERGSATDNAPASGSHSDVDRQSAAHADTAAPRTPQSAERAPVDDSHTGNNTPAPHDSGVDNAVPQRTPESKRIDTAGEMEAAGLQSRSLMYIAAGLTAATIVLGIVAWQLVPGGEADGQKVAGGVDAGEGSGESTVATSGARTGGQGNSDAEATPEADATRADVGPSDDAGFDRSDASSADRDDTGTEPEESEAVAAGGEQSPEASSSSGDDSSEGRGGRPAESESTGDERESGTGSPSPGAGDRPEDDETDPVAEESSGSESPEPSDRETGGSAAEAGGGGGGTGDDESSESSDDVDKELEKMDEWMTNE